MSGPSAACATQIPVPLLPQVAYAWCGRGGSARPLTGPRRGAGSLGAEPALSVGERPSLQPGYRPGTVIYVRVRRFQPEHSRRHEAPRNLRRCPSLHARAKRLALCASADSATHLGSSTSIRREPPSLPAMDVRSSWRRTAKPRESSSRCRRIESGRSTTRQSSSRPSRTRSGTPAAARGRRRSARAHSRRRGP
jgi:hypothetical protein